ncbi:amidohydrolase family protein [Novipirellula artificiosorum]|uniref:Imidazolonepropionase n=1 Tax=Novipirellula artificiosorum TaxID=2528016 RepID=A0A5C6DXU7_9BACT|nr:amidohydrolase family protein [Novipirellula artificiosorum]TWU40667.1 imidazolonepropionase [Novipirellula artificiosorum]
MIIKSVLPVWVAAALFVVPAPVHANDQIPGSPQTTPILIRGATLHPIEGDVIERGSLLFEQGRITAIGRHVRPPEGTEVIKADRKHVYPGLIEPLTDIGLREISAVDVTIDRDELGQRNPNVRSWVAVNPDSELIPVARAGGVLIAHVAPGGRFVQGQSAVMMLDGWTAAEMTLLAPSGLCVAWGTMQPNDKDSVEQARERDQKWREFDEWIEQAKRYAAKQASESEPIAEDLRLEALLPVLRREMPLIVSVDRQSGIESAVAYAVEHDFRLVIYGGYEAEACADLLKRHNVAVIVAGVYRLPMHRDDPYDAAYTLPERLRRAGVHFAIGGEGSGYPGGASNVRNLPYHAACAVAYGLPREDAIRRITLSAAEVLGVEDRVGSLTVGKDATIVIADGDLLETQTNVTEAFIQGRRVDLSSKHTMLFEKYKKKYGER